MLAGSDAVVAVRHRLGSLVQALEKARQTAVTAESRQLEDELGVAIALAGELARAVERLSESDSHP